jgi:hypothetical protein
MSGGREAGVSRVDAMVRAIDPLAGATLEDGGLDGALDAIGSAIVSRGGAVNRSRVWWRRWLAMPRGIAVVGVAGLAAGGLAAAATVFVNARTGLYPKNRWEVKAGGPGEYLNPSGTNFRDVARQASSDISYPAGYQGWLNWLITQDMSQPSAPCPTGSRARCLVRLSTGALRGSIATDAFCAWLADWRQAKQSGDGAAAARATLVISQAPSWNAVRALDPHPYAVPPYTGAHPMSDFGWLLPYRQEVRAADVSAVNQLLGGHFGACAIPFMRPPVESDNGMVLPSPLRPR